MAKATEIAILANHRHPRLRYVLYQLSDWWGIKLRLFTDRERYEQHHALAKINYGAPITDSKEIIIVTHPIMSGQVGEKAILTSEVANIHFKEKRNIPAFCFEDKEYKSPVNYDPFALIFFCLSRYEEYQTDERDNHGRFSAIQSHAFKNGYLTRPIVNEHLDILAQRLQLAFPECQLSLPDYQLQLTYDIDIPYAYRGRGWRGIGSGIKDLLTGHFQRAFNRAKCLINSKQQDPYDVYDWLEALHLAHGIKSRYFFLLSEQSNRFDPNPSPEHPAVKALIKRLAKNSDIGIHPSYYASDKPALFGSERKSLVEISKQSIEHSRQHFLRFQLPDTYRQLLKAGLRHDHSMGYADHIGFRAGTNLSFYWYDLEKEERTWLRVHPFAAMDVSLRRYHQLGYFDSQKEILELAEHVKDTGGPFTLLWHNSSFAIDYGWSGWEKMYENLVAKLAKADET